MEANDEFKKPFKDNSLDVKESIYFDILGNNKEIRSARELLKILKEQFPNDPSINLSRVGREFREIVNHKKLRKNCRPIIPIKEWVSKYYVTTRIKDMLCDVQEFSKFDMGMFLKLEVYQAALLGQMIRESFKNLHCFVISDCDTVLVRFGEKESYEVFLSLCKKFIPNFSNQ